jgi:hypothetical protein
MVDLFMFLHQFMIGGIHLDIIAGWIVTIILTAKVFCAMTPTPDPVKYPVWSKVYRFIEYAAILVGYAKDVGFAPNAVQNQVIADAPKVIGAVEGVATNLNKVS